MTEKTYQRQWRNLLIHKKLQLRLISINLIYMLLIIIATFAVQFSPLLQDMFFSGDQEVQYQAAQIFLPLLQRFVPAVIVMFILIFLHQMLFTHRIFGPLINFTHTFERIAEGDLSRKVQLRKADFLDAEGEKINRMTETISRYISNSREGIDQLVALTGRVLDQSKEQDKEAILAALTEIRKQALLTQQSLAVFKTGSTNSTLSSSRLIFSQKGQNFSPSHQDHKS